MKKISLNEIFMYSLGAVIVIGFFLTLIISMVYPIPEANEKVAYLTIGALIGAFTGVVGYFFGSSMGSKQKTEIISKQNGSLPQK